MFAQNCSIFVFFGSFNVHITERSFIFRHGQFNIKFRFAFWFIPTRQGPASISRFSFGYKFDKQKNIEKLHKNEKKRKKLKKKRKKLKKRKKFDFKKFDKKNLKKTKKFDQKKNTKERKNLIKKIKKKTEKIEKKTKKLEN